jgi:hypothetical protein
MGEDRNAAMIRGAPVFPSPSGMIIGPIIMAVDDRRGRDPTAGFRQRPGA